MARWKPIESAPTDRNFLVDGGEIESELYAGQPQTEPAKVSPSHGIQFACVDVCGYGVWVNNPLFWTDLPERHISLALPRPAEFNCAKCDTDLKFSLPQNIYRWGGETDDRAFCSMDCLAQTVPPADAPVLRPAQEFDL